jgi:hypothetical protein
VLGPWAGCGSPLPQAKSPSNVALLVIRFAPESHCRGSGSFVLRGGGGSQKLSVAWVEVHTPRKIRAQFQEYKDTSLIFIVVTFYELRFYGVLKKLPEKSVKNTAIE